MSSTQHIHSLSCGCHNRIAAYFASKITAETTEALTDRREVAAGEQKAAIFHTSHGGLIRPIHQGDASLHEEALGILDDRIIAVGSYDAVKSAMSGLITPDKTEEVALQPGQCLIPGLIEPHVHIVSSALTISWHDYTPFGKSALTSADQDKPLHSQNMRPDYNLKTLLAQLGHDANNVKKGDWLLGFGVDPALFEDFRSLGAGKNLLNAIDRHTLDSVSETTPILLLSASCHTIYANTIALKLTWEKQHPSGYKDESEYIDKTNGVLQEEPQMLPIVKTIPTLQSLTILGSILSNIDLFFKACRKRGVTMVYDAGMQSDFQMLLNLYLHDKRYQHAMRIGMANLLGSEEAVNGFDWKFTPPKAPSDGPLMGTIDFYYGSVKLISDGSNQGLTGYQSTPYCCPPASNFGIYNYLANGAPQDQAPSKTPPDALINMIKGIHDKGWQIMIHANGDQAIDYALDAFSQLNKADITDRRHRIEHCSLLDDTRVDSITQYGLSPSFLIGHVGYWGWAFNSYIFEKKADSQLDRCGSVAAKGVRFTLHSDCTVSPLGPLRMMEQAVTRTMEASGANNEILNQNERVTTQQALRAATYDAAWQCHADHLVGSLEPGKLADFVILGQDPLELNADTAFMKMRDISVDQVWIGGKRITD